MNKETQNDMILDFDIFEEKTQHSQFENNLICRCYDLWKESGVNYEDVVIYLEKLGLLKS